METIAFLGLGAMGSRMVKHILKAGYTVNIWNRSEKALSELLALGATIKPTPFDAALDANFVICMVRDEKASKYVWLDKSAGALRAMKETAIAIECSTLTPEWISQLEERCIHQGVELVDAPVAGSRPQAEMAQLIFLVGANARVFAKVNPLLAVMASKVNRVGDTSSGAKLKLIINALLGMQVAGIAELLGYLEKADINLQEALDILSHTPVISAAAAGAANAMIADNFAAAFPIELVEKDLGYLISSAEVKSSDAPLSSFCRGLFKKAYDLGYGELNINAIAKLYL